MTPLAAGTIATIKATIPVLEAHGVAITEAMYGKLLRDPAVAEMFNETDQKTGRQPRALAAAVLAYARNIDNLGAMKGAVERIAEKHVGLNVQADQYPVVGKALLGAISDVLGDAATPEILDAWGQAYGLLAEILIGREKTLYQAHADAPGGWVGWRDFRIEKRVVETDAVTSFWLTPTDGKPVMIHLPGQYLTLAINANGSSFRRNYSISSAPDETRYRISVKRESPGTVSNWLHDHGMEGTVIRVSAPAGKFVLKQNEDRPVALVSAGIGITPLLGMLETLAGTDRPVSVFHATHNENTFAFPETLAQAAHATNVSVEVFFSDSASSTTLDPAFHVTRGHLTASALKARQPTDAAYYICGPRSFQRDVIDGLLALGVAGDALHHEFFGPDEGTLAA